MPYKNIEQRKAHNREARKAEYTELKTLRAQITRIKEIVQSGIPGNEAIVSITKILSPDPSLSPYWQKQKDLALAAQAKHNKGDTT
jgi:hypothetical protein